jgi:hypothetical protein
MLHDRPYLKNLGGWLWDLAPFMPQDVLGANGVPALQSLITLQTFLVVNTHGVTHCKHFMGLIALDERDVSQSMLR